MIKGAHNSFTGFPIIGYTKYISWFIKPFSQCQGIKDINEIITCRENGIFIYDIQVALRKGEFMVSHGISWYDISLKSILYNLDLMSHCYLSLGGTNDTYVMIGLDNHWFQSKKYKEYQIREFKKLISNISHVFPYLKFIRFYVENPWNILYEHKETTNNMLERYWSTAWAKSMMKHWWQFYYYIPIPRLWKWIYGKCWDKEAEDSGKEFYVTDFV